jgi:hypothetical protein
MSTQNTVPPITFSTVDFAQNLNGRLNTHRFCVHATCMDTIAYEFAL